MAPIAMIAVLGTFLAGCQGPKTDAEAPKPVVTAELGAGIPVPMVLLKSLESGVDEEGSDVPLLVSEDVKDAQGRVLIEKGTPAQGRVTWSRREEMLGGLMNRPARLKFDLVATVSVDGQAIDLCANKEKPEDPYELNRGNTGRPRAARELEAMFEDERDQAVLKAMNDIFEGKEAELLELQESRDRLASIGQKLQLPGLASLAQQNQVGKVKPLLNGLRSGGPINEVARHLNADSPALAAVMEWTGIAGAVSDRLGGFAHGRNIKAYVGTPVQGFVEKPATVKISG
ncbi:MAG: hypothetical protein ACO1SV_08930 [Fimbriimonas sp.]